MKDIFIGSSTEGKDQAEKVAEILKNIPNVTPLLWTSSFHVGEITFSAIEDIAAKVSGAVFLATPDDDSVIRNKRVKIPRANVLFEYGYLTAMLRRNRVALCRYDNVQLPSDFEGLTYISMGQFEPHKEIEDKPKQTLMKWASDLHSIHAGLPPTRQLHGYSGFWYKRMEFQKYEGRVIQNPDYVVFDGEVILYIPLDGEGGEGSCFGSLRIKMDGCEAEFAVSDKLTSVKVLPDGSMTFHNTVQSRQLITLTGTPPQKEGFEPQLHGVRGGDSEILCEPDEVGILHGIHHRVLGINTVSSEAIEKLCRRHVR
jgi:hypothetical protein